MSDVLWRHQVLIKPSIFSQAESLLCFRQTIFTQQQQQQQQLVSCAAAQSAAMRGELETSPSAVPEYCKSFVVVTPLSYVPSLSFISPSHSKLPPPTHTPLGSPPPALLPSHGQWSWDGLELETRLIRHKSNLLQAIICWVIFSKGCSPPCLSRVHHSNLPEADK